MSKNEKILKPSPDSEPSPMEEVLTPTDEGVSQTLEEDKEEEKDMVLPDTDSPEENRALRAESMKTFGRLSTFGLNLLLAVLVGYVIGHFIDDLFGIKYPVFTVFWVLCGVAFAVMELVKTIKAAIKLGSDSNNSNKPENP